MLIFYYKRAIIIIFENKIFKIKTDYIKDFSIKYKTNQNYKFFKFRLNLFIMFYSLMYIIYELTYLLI